MWRALFLAIGVVLIMSGVECLIVGRFMIQEAHLPAFVNKALDGQNKQTAKSNNRTPAPQYTNQGYGGVPSSASRYDSSRFSNDGFFPNTSSRSSTGSNSTFSLTGFGSKQSNPSDPQVRPVKVVNTRDWMPWSLVAAGVIIVLYTNKLANGSGGGE